MSRIGMRTIEVPEKVDVTIDGNHVKVKGPRGEIERDFHPSMTIVRDEEGLQVQARRQN